MDEAQNSPVPILFLIDCEPDPRETVPGATGYWKGYERTHALLTEWRQRNSDCQNMHFSWFWRMDPQIETTYGHAAWATRTYADRIMQCESAGDEIGLHTHAWRWDTAIERWIEDYGSPAWVETCLRLSFDAFESRFGRPCRIFRFGDGWLDDAAVHLLEQLGVEIDLTLEPGRGATKALVKGELTTGLIPDRRGVPRYPYRPSRQDFRRIDANGQSSIWMLPVTTCRASLLRIMRHARTILADKSISQTLTLPLNLGLRSWEFRAMFEQAMRRKNRPYITICARTDAGSIERQFRNAARNLDFLLTHPLYDRFLFETPSAMASRLGKRQN